MAPSAVVSTTDGTSQFLLARGVIGQWSTWPSSVPITSTTWCCPRCWWRRATATPDRPSSGPSQRGGRLVFLPTDRLDGSLDVFDVRAMTGATVVTLA